MKRIVWLTIFMTLALPSWGSKKNKIAESDWQSGKLVGQSITLEDAGCAGGVCGGTYKRTHYTVEVGNYIYTANRTGGTLDITVNAPVKIAVERNSIYIMDAKGKPHECHLEQKTLKE